MEQVLIIGQQMISFVILIAIGYLAVRLKVLDQRGLATVASLVIRVFLPMLIFTNTINGATAEILLQCSSIIVAVFVMDFLLWGLGICTGRLGRLGGETYRAHQAMCVFGNMGFIGIPLLLALFPQHGMAYLAAYTVPDQLLLWTLGVRLTTPKGSSAPDWKQNLKKMVNPCTAAITLAVIFVFAGIELPEIVNKTLTSVGGVSGTISLIYIGGLFYYAEWSKTFTRPAAYLIVVCKMLVAPVVVYVLVLLCRIPQEISFFLAISASMPVMASLSMVANENGSDGEYVLSGVVVTTACCILTIPAVGWLTSLAGAWLL
ncbi:MAG: AEC family transporter [Eubacteriales bacterium]|jgi:predicted permease